MNRAVILLFAAALWLTGCGPAAPVSTAKADPTTEAWYSETTARLTTMMRTAEQLFQNGKTQEAAAIVTSGQSLQNRLLTAPRPTLAAMEAIADLDRLYGQLLMANGSYGSARMLFQNNVTRWKTWKPQTPETEERLKQANADLAACDRHMGA